MKRIKIIIGQALLLTIVSIAVAHSQEPSGAVKPFAESVKEDAKQAGAAVKDGAVKVGMAAKQVAEQVADAAKQGAHEVADAARQGVAKSKAVVSGNSEASANKDKADP